MSSDTTNTNRSTQKTSRETNLQRETLIAQAAYLRAEKRGFRGGDPVADWLEAEAEIDALLARGGSSADRGAAHAGAGPETDKAGAEKHAPPADPASTPAQRPAPTRAAERTDQAAGAQRSEKAPRRSERASGRSEKAPGHSKKPARSSEKATPSSRKAPRSEESGQDDDYQHALAAQLKAGTERLDELRPKLAELKAGMRKELEREVRRLDTLREDLAEKAGEVRRKSQKRGGALKQQAEKLLRDFKTGLERLGSRFDR